MKITITKHRNKLDNKIITKKIEWTNQLVAHRMKITITRYGYKVKNENDNNIKIQI